MQLPKMSKQWLGKATLCTCILGRAGFIKRMIFLFPRGSSLVGFLCGHPCARVRHAALCRFGRVLSFLCRHTGRRPL